MPGRCQQQGCQGLYQHQPGSTGLRMPAPCFVEGLQELSTDVLELCCLRLWGCRLCRLPASLASLPNSAATGTLALEGKGELIVPQQRWEWTQTVSGRNSLRLSWLCLA